MGTYVDEWCVSVSYQAEQECRLAAFWQYRGLARRLDVPCFHTFSGHAARVFGAILSLVTGEDVCLRDAVWSADKVRQLASEAKWPEFEHVEETCRENRVCLEREDYALYLTAAQAFIRTCVEQEVGVAFFWDEQKLY